MFNIMSQLIYRIDDNCSSHPVRWRSSCGIELIDFHVPTRSGCMICKRFVIERHHLYSNMQFPLREAAARTSALLRLSRKATLHFTNRQLSVTCSKCLGLNRVQMMENQLSTGRMIYEKQISGKNIIPDLLMK